MFVKFTETTSMGHDLRDVYVAPQHVIAVRAVDDDVSVIVTSMEGICVRGSAGSVADKLSLTRFDPPQLFTQERA